MAARLGRSATLCLQRAISSSRLFRRKACTARAPGGKRLVQAALGCAALTSVSPCRRSERASLCASPRKLEPTRVRVRRLVRQRTDDCSDFIYSRDAFWCGRPRSLSPPAVIRKLRDPTGNQLLAALPPGELQRWIPQLEHVEMPLGQVLYESGTTLSHV